MSPMMGGMNGVQGDSYSNSLRGLSGLSGFDRDGMIKTMTLRSRSRIAKYKQKLQKLSWKQEAMQSISDKLIELSRKYLNVTSENSLIRESTFKNYKVESVGDYKNNITATGSPRDLEGIHIMGISGKASDATYISSKINGTGELTTGSFDLSEPVHFGALEGKGLNIRIGLNDKAKDYEVRFIGGNYDIYKRKADGTLELDTDGNQQLDELKVKKVKTLFQESFRQTKVRMGNNDFTMADFIKVDFKLDSNSKKIETLIKVNDEFKVGGENGKPLGSLNSLFIMPGGSASQEQGINGVGSKGYDLNSPGGGFTLTNNSEALIGGYSSDGTWNNIGSKLLLGGSITFSLDGVRRTVVFPKRTDNAEASDPPNAVMVKKEGIRYNLNDPKDVTKYINKELNDLYGRGNITVTYDENAKKISFKPKSGSSLVITEGSGHLIGEENVFKMKSGTSNKVGLNLNLRESGDFDIIKKLDAYAQTQSAGGGVNYTSFAEMLEKQYELEFNINGNRINIKTDKVVTLGDLINELNNADNITKRGGDDTSGYNSIFQVAYDRNSDSFIFTSKDRGANTKLDQSGLLWGSLGNESKLTEVLFGDYDAGIYKDGQNAKVFYKTADSDTVKELISFDNHFSINNARFNIEGGFNVTDSGQLIDGTTAGVSFKSSVEADKIVETVKNMIKDYNEIMGLIGKHMKTLPERSKSTSRLKYEPLTEEQREKMSEKEIEKWEAKAKEGLLFADPTLRGAKDELSGIIYYNRFSVSRLESIGIKQSAYSNNKESSIEFDEAKFREALNKDPEAVKSIFMGNGSFDVGFAHNLKSVIANNASDTGAYKGSLVEMAGSKYAPGSVFTNTMFNQIDMLKKNIDFYEKRLKNDEDRYIKRFSHLEKIMKKAEMQSGYIMNLQGY